MSIRIYHLLRNNKEQGPFTAEELIQQKLKPYDLIWIDGRSAAWSYPGELPEFRTHVPQPGGQDSNTQVNKQQNTATVSPSIQAAIAVNDNIAQPVIKQKPRYKISAAWSKIQTITNPGYKEIIVEAPQAISLSKNEEIKQPSGFQPHSLSWEDAWLDWKKEEKTIQPVIEPAKAKPVVVPQSKTINENYVAPPLETKYSASLDSLKEKYIENIRQQKQKSKKGVSFGKASEFVLPSIALLIIFSVGYWLLHNTSGPAPVSNSNEAKQAQTEAVPITNKPATSPTDNVSNTTTQPITTDKQNVTSANGPVVTDQAEERKPVYLHNAKVSVTKQEHDSKHADKLPLIKATLPDLTAASQKTAGTPAKQPDAATINNASGNNSYSNSPTSASGDLNAADNRPVRRRTDATDNNTANQSSQKSEPVVPKPSPVKTGADYVNVPKYIRMSDGTADLKIENISDVNLDLVVVDVQYYDASGNFHKGETMYVHNLKAGKNVTIKTPKDTSSLYATSKVSVVSSDANNLYIVGDN